MGERCEIIEDKLDNHLEKYEQNGKELMRLAMAIENITKEIRDHRKSSEENKAKRLLAEAEFKKELKPILDSYQTLLTGRKWIIGTVSFIFAIGSLYLLIGKIFYK